MERLLITKNGALYSSTIAGAAANSLTTRNQLDLLQPGGMYGLRKVELVVLLLVLILRLWVKHMEHLLWVYLLDLTLELVL